MANIAVGEAIAEGFHLIGRKPFTVVAWGFLQLAVSAVAVGMMGPLYMALFEETLRSAGGGGPPDPMAFQAQALQMQGMSYLFNGLALAVGAVTYCAVFRSILKPQDSRWAYLRLGMTELYAGVLVIGGYFAALFGLLLLIIPVAIVIGVLAATKAVAAAVVVGIVAVLAVLLVGAYLALRFSMAVPMMVDDGQFHVLESWTLTRGQGGRLLLMAVGLMLVVMLLYLVYVMVMAAVGFAGVGLAAGGFGNLKTFFQRPPREVLTSVLPTLVLISVLTAPLSGGLAAISGAPFARAYRDLAPPDVSKTFT